MGRNLNRPSHDSVIYTINRQLSTRFQFSARILLLVFSPIHSILNRWFVHLEWLIFVVCSLLVTTAFSVLVLVDQYRR